MDFKLDHDKIEAAVIKQASDAILDAENGEAFSRYLAGIQKNIDARIDALFADRADALIQDALDKAIKDGFEREYARVNQWGKREDAGTTSISKELERLVSSYWSERVDRNGKRTDSTYSAITRAEYLMTQICADDFSKAMTQAATDVTGALKDGMRNQIGKHMDQMLNNLFKVKSLQDQGKTEKSF